MPGRPVNHASKREAALAARIAALEAGAIAITGELRAFAFSSPPSGWLEANGTAVLISTYPDLDEAIYCGNSLNATASWGYRATTNVSPDSNRSTSGTYIVLPDFRGEFLRGWDNGRGKDSGRGFFAAQLDELKEHTHTATSEDGGDHIHTGIAISNGAHDHPYSQTSVTTNTNTEVGGGANRVTSSTETTVSTGIDGAHAHLLAINSDGIHSHVINIDEAGDMETRPTNLAALICIKT